MRLRKEEQLVQSPQGIEIAFKFRSVWVQSFKAHPLVIAGEKCCPSTCSLVTVLMLWATHALKQLLSHSDMTLGSPCFIEKRKTHTHEARIVGTLGVLWHLNSEEQPDRKAERSWARFFTPRPQFSPPVNRIILCLPFSVSGKELVKKLCVKSLAQSLAVIGTP